MNNQYRIVHYRENGRDFFQEWLDDLQDLQARTAIERRIKRLKSGNFGEHRPCRSGVWELVLNIGPGYRIYYSMIEKIVVLLICAGDKSSQKTDINKAVSYIKKYKEEHYNDN